LKKIISYIKNFYTDHLNKYELVFALIFVASFAYLNYATDIIQDVWTKSYWDDQIFSFHFILYLSPIVVGYLSSSFFNKNWSIWLKGKFWLLILLAAGVFSFRSSVHLITQPWFESLRSYEHYNWIRSIISTVMRSAALFLPLAVYWLFTDRKNQRYYGFTLKNFDTKPYFVMLLIMLPLIILASTQGDFLGAYPRGQKFHSLAIENSAHWKYFGLYELVYGLDFISIEFFFRGFMVLAFVGLLGPRAILPMAMFYVVIHWGKPAGELISSFFGGMLLGIISYYGKSIIGGIIVHMGIAWMMEIGALVGNYFNS
jgi:hypothetical protein